MLNTICLLHRVYQMCIQHEILTNYDLFGLQKVLKGSWLQRKGDRYRKREATHLYPHLKSITGFGKLETLHTNYSTHLDLSSNNKNWVNCQEVVFPPMICLKRRQLTQNPNEVIVTGFERGFFGVLRLFLFVYLSVDQNDKRIRRGSPVSTSVITAELSNEPVRRCRPQGVQQASRTAPKWQV